LWTAPEEKKVKLNKEAGIRNTEVEKVSSNYPRQYHHSPLSFSAVEAVFKKFSLFCHMCISFYNLPTSLQLNLHFKKQDRSTAKKNKKENKSSTYDHFI